MVRLIKEWVSGEYKFYLRQIFKGKDANYLCSVSRLYSQEGYASGWVKSPSEAILLMYIKLAQNG